MTTEKTVEKRKSANDDSDDASSQEKLLSSIDQLTQVLDILGKLVHRIKYQVEAMPSTTGNDKETFTTDTQANSKKDSLVH
ncbi:MAG: hypothetical protein ACRBCI_08950 [Cellvibrionaceae bacterium]